MLHSVENMVRRGVLGVSDHRPLSPFAPRKCASTTHFRGAKGDNEIKKKPPSGKYHSAVLVLLLRADYRQEAECSSRATELRRRLCGSLLSSLLLGYFLLGCSLLRCCSLLSSFLSYLLLRCPSFFLGHGYILRKAKLLVAAPIEHQKQ